MLPVALRRLFAKERMGAEIAIAMAILTLTATVVAMLQQQASIESDRWGRREDEYGTQAVGRNVSTALQASTDFGVYRRWFEQLQRANWAFVRRHAGTGDVDLDLLSVLNSVDGDLVAWTEERSEVFKPPYYDASLRSIDFNQYVADRIVGPVTLAREQRDVARAVGDGWSAKANTYVTILTILAVSLFFLGLGASLGPAVRPYLAGAGAVFGLAAMAWTGLTWGSGVHETPHAAIERVVEARQAISLAEGLGVVGEVSDEVQAHYRAAIEAADAAIDLDAGYGSALLAAADARLALAGELRLSGGDPAAAGALLAGARGAYEVYLKGNRASYVVWGDLGWGCYLAGDLERARAALDEAIALAPDQFPLHVSRAITRLAAGDDAGARDDVARAIEVAAGGIAGANTTNFANADYELGRVAAWKPEQAVALNALRTRLREAEVALSVRGEPTGNPGAVDLPPLELVTLRRDDTGAFVPDRAVADGGTVSVAGDPGFDVIGGGVGFRLTLDGEVSDPEATVTVRLWRDGYVDASYNLDFQPGHRPRTELDLVSPWGRGDFRVDAGDYELVVYVDGVTRGTLAFTVVNE